MNKVVSETRNEPGNNTESNAPQRIEPIEPANRRELAARYRANQASPSALHRTASAIRTVVPLVQKLLPLLEGNVASAVANLVAPRLLGPPTVNLVPIETSLMKLRSEIAVVIDRHTQQEGTLKRIDDQLEAVKESLERTASEHQEVSEEVRKVRRNVVLVSVVGMVLLAVSIGLNVALYFYVKGTVH